jgi:hypothetical protein
VNPFFKEWLLQSLQKSAGSGGLTFLEEILELLPIENVKHIHDACARILKKQIPEISVKPAASSSKSSAGQ